MKKLKFVFAGFFLFFSTFASAIHLGPQGVAIQGTILNPQGLPLESASVVFTVEIRSPGTENCLLYHESHTLNMSSSGGAFSFILGHGSRSGTNFEDTSTLPKVFNNAVTALSGLRCDAGSTYTPNSSDQRNIVLYFNDGSGQHVIDQHLNVQTVPYALHADKLQGFVPSDFLKLATTPALTQSNVENVFSASNYANLVSLLSVQPSQYLVVGSNGSTSFPSPTVDPATPAAGQIWYNSTTNVIKYYDGSSVQTVGNTSSVDGSAITSGTIGGATAISTTGNLQTKGSVTAAKFFLYDHSGNGPGYIGLQSPADVSASSYTITFPSSAGGTGQVLSTDGTGTLSWVDRTPTGTASGDLYGSYPSPKVRQIQGVAISSVTPSSSGQVLRYDGSKWAPNFISMFDLRSTITGTQSFSGVGCTVAQTLTWTSATDNLACTNISISGSQVSFANQAVNTFFAAPSSGTGAPSFRAMAVTDLPLGGYDSVHFKNTGNSFGVDANLGTKDAHALSLMTNNGARLTILSSGSVGIGTASPTANLHLQAGTSAGQTAPLKFTAGTNLATPEAGAVEFDGSNLYFTDSSVIRRTLASTNSASAQTFSSALTASASGTGLAVTNNETIGGTLTVSGKISQNFSGAGPATALTNSSSSSGDILDLTSTTTAAVSGDKGLSIAVSGANATSTVTRYGVYSNVTSTGTSSTDVAGYFSASGATNNYGLIVANGNVGLGTTAPAATLDVRGHIANSGAAATVGTCGTSPAITGNDTRGVVTVGTGTVTSCIITFNSTFTTAPYCVTTWSGSASVIGVGVTATTTTLTLNFSASAAGLKVNYHCLQ